MNEIMKFAKTFEDFGSADGFEFKKRFRVEKSAIISSPFISCSPI